MSYSSGRGATPALFHWSVLAFVVACAGEDGAPNNMGLSPVQGMLDSGPAPVAMPGAPDASRAVDASTTLPVDSARPMMVDSAVQPMDTSVPSMPDAAPVVTAEAGTSVGEAGMSSEAGATTGGGGAFPRTAEVNVTSKGPYTFKSYSEGLTDPAYDSAVMYYPENAPVPLAVIVFSPGFTATKENYTKLGEIFASHGFAMMLTTPTSTLDFPPERGKDLVAAVARVKTENERAGSPLQGKLAPDRVCVTGQSMGGGGTLWAATELGDKIRCAVPLQPWEPGTRFAMIKAPTLFIAAEADTVADVAGNTRVHYDSIPNTVEKIFAEFKGADHYLTTNRTTMWDDQARVMVSFYKLKLEDDQRYAAYLYGGMEPKSALSRFEYSKK